MLDRRLARQQSQPAAKLSRRIQHSIQHQHHHQTQTTTVLLRATKRRLVLDQLVNNRESQVIAHGPPTVQQLQHDLCRGLMRCILGSQQQRVHDINGQHDHGVAPACMPRLVFRERSGRPRLDNAAYSRLRRLHDLFARLQPQAHLAHAPRRQRCRRVHGSKAVEKVYHRDPHAVFDRPPRHVHQARQRGDGLACGRDRLVHQHFVDAPVVQKHRIVHGVQRLRPVRQADHHGIDANVGLLGLAQHDLRRVLQDR